MSISTIIKSVQNIMRKDTGVDGDAQRISQLTWMIFLKVFDSKEQEWELIKKDYKPVIEEGYRWRDWAQNDEGITGDKLLSFVNNELFVKLKEIEINENTDIKKVIVKSIFEDSFNYMKSGTLLRELINKLNEINFNNQEERHMFNDIYETILKDLQSAGNSGEYYTPRAVTQFIVDVISPKLGEKILDPACGTGGFLVSSLEILKKQVKNIEEQKELNGAILGIEKKQLPHMLAMTNLILHDIDEPKIRHDNSLTRNVRDYKTNEKVDVVVTNPPFGGSEEDGISINFPKEFQTKETADLFIVLIMYLLKENGRCGVVLPDGFLSGEGIKTNIKRKLLEECNLHTIIRLPNTVFSPYATVSTNILFFEKGQSTKEIWYYEHSLPKGQKSYSKTKPINIKEFDIEKQWWINRKETDSAWKVDINQIKNNNYNLDIKNPNKKIEENDYNPIEIIHDMLNSEKEIEELLFEIEEEIKFNAKI